MISCLFLTCLLLHLALRPEQPLAQAGQGLFFCNIGSLPRLLSVVSKESQPSLLTSTGFDGRLISQDNITGRDMRFLCGQKEKLLGLPSTAQ